MINATYLLLDLAVYAVLIATLVLYLPRISGKRRPGVIAAMFMAFAVSLALSAYQWYHGMSALDGAPLAAGISVFFVMAAISYFDRKETLYPLLAVAAILIALSAASGQSIQLFMLAFSVGTIAGITVSLRHIGNKNHNARSHGRKDTEINRDIFQICSGIAVLAIFLVAFGAGKYAVMAIVLLGYASVSYLSANGSGSNALAKALLSLERPNTMFGFGALYLAAGAFLVIALVPDFRLMVFGLVALFIADSLATISGLRIKSPRLPYNKAKSVVGSAVYFAVLAIFGMLFLGYYAIAAAAVLAFVEGISSRIDDNISVASALVVMSAIAML